MKLLQQIVNFGGYGTVLPKEMALLWNASDTLNSRTGPNAAFASAGSVTDGNGGVVAANVPAIHTIGGRKLMWAGPYGANIAGPALGKHPSTVVTDGWYDFSAVGDGSDAVYAYYDGSLAADASKPFTGYMLADFLPEDVGKSVRVVVKRQTGTSVATFLIHTVTAGTNTLGPLTFTQLADSYGVRVAIGSETDAGFVRTIKPISWFIAQSRYDFPYIAPGVTSSSAAGATSFPLYGSAAADKLRACLVGNKTRVVAIGDSITNSAYPGLLEVALVGSDVLNLGVSGSQTAAMLTRVNSIAVPFGPLVATVLGGINDIISDVPEDTIKSNITAIVAALVSAGAAVRLSTTTPFKGSASWSAGRQIVQDSLNTWILTNNFGPTVTAVDTYSPLEDPGVPDTLLATYDSGDHIHLATAGSEVLATTFAATIDWEAFHTIIASPAMFTAVALVLVGAGSDELPNSTNIPILSCRGIEEELLFTRNNSSGVGLIASSNDGVNGSTVTGEWDEYEYHRKIITSNGTQIRVGTQRLTSEMVPIDADYIFDTLRTFDGSYNPKTDLVFGYNNSTPLWIAHLQVWNSNPNTGTLNEWINKYYPVGE